MKIILYNQKYEVPNSVIKKLKDKKLSKSDIDNMTTGYMVQLMTELFNQTCTTDVLRKFQSTSYEQGKITCDRGCIECVKSFIKAMNAKEIRNR